MAISAVICKADTSIRGEGLVIKNPLAAYDLNGRSEQWVKVKPGTQNRGCGMNLKANFILSNRVCR